MALTLAMSSLINSDGAAIKTWRLPGGPQFSLSVLSLSPLSQSSLRMSTYGQYRTRWELRVSAGLSRCLSVGSRPTRPSTPSDLAWPDPSPSGTWQRQEQGWTPVPGTPPPPPGTWPGPTPPPRGRQHSPRRLLTMHVTFRTLQSSSQDVSC